MGCLVAAITLKCTDLTSLRVKTGTDQTRGQYYEDEDDEDEDHTTDAQWKIIEHIINLVIKVVRMTEALKTLDISFDLHNISRFLIAHKYIGINTIIGGNLRLSERRNERQIRWSRTAARGSSKKFQR